jgi:glucose-1-phosphate thymidylyltransferase
MRYHEADSRRLRKSGVLEVDGQDRVLSMEEKPEQPRSCWCCPPFYFYARRDAALVRQAISEGCGVDAPGSYIAWLCGRSDVYAMEMPGRRYDVGDLQSYEAVSQLYRGIRNVDETEEGTK